MIDTEIPLLYTHMIAEDFSFWTQTRLPLAYAREPLRRISAFWNSEGGGSAY
jgi:hypothetical protein